SLPGREILERWNSARSRCPRLLRASASFLGLAGNAVVIIRAIFPVIARGVIGADTAIAATGLVEGCYFGSILRKGAWRMTRHTSRSSGCRFKNDATIDGRRPTPSLPPAAAPAQLLARSEPESLIGLPRRDRIAARFAAERLE